MVLEINYEIHVYTSMEVVSLCDTAGWELVSGAGEARRTLDVDVDIMTSNPESRREGAIAETRQSLNPNGFKLIQQQSHFIYIGAIRKFHIFTGQFFSLGLELRELELLLHHRHSLRLVQ